jgi:c-di-GMP-binding flagellar brake protein YcgR
MESAFKLKSQSAKQAVDAAVRTHAQVVLESAAFGDTTLNGFLISGDDHALLIEITGEPALDFDRIEGVSCEGQMYSDRRYRFTTTIMAVPEWGKTRAVAIARPTALSVIDRRRFLRTRLAPPTTVLLEWGASNARHSHRVSLLNISADGMACRVRDDVLFAIDQNEPIRISFELPGVDRAFRLAARLTNTVPGSEGSTIIGLQFTAAKEDAKAISALRIVIEGGSRASEESEVCV